MYGAVVGHSGKWCLRKNQSADVKSFLLVPLLKSETLPVTCGDKKGILYPDKLAKGTSLFTHHQKL